MNRILFGGNFDPIHMGHLNMAFSAHKEFNGNVIFIPSKTAIWKEKSVSIAHKLAMVELAIKDYSYFSIDKYEIDNENETTYSIDTVKYFKNKYQEDNLYFLIGLDQVDKFHLWKEAKQISEMVQIIFFARDGYSFETNNIKKFNMLQISGTANDISSSNIRDLNSAMTPMSVLRYIEENELYYIPRVKNYLSDKRYKHSLEVAHLAYSIAKKYDDDVLASKSYIAGILHDIGKEIDKQEAKQIMNDHFKEFVDMNLGEFANHQFVGSYIAKNDFQINDSDILSAIEFHATGKDQMTLLGMIVYASDKIEPTRGFDSSGLIKEMMKNPFDGFKIVLLANKVFLENHRSNVNNQLTSKCFDDYLK